MKSLSHYFCLANSLALLLLSSVQFLTPVLGGAVCKSSCASINRPWSNKCKGKKCGGCPECPVKLYECPVASNDPFVMPSGTRVKLFVTKKNNQLCTLTRKSVDDTGVELFSSIARSYNKHHWENSAGAYATLELTCKKWACELELPSIENGSTDVFQLTTFDLGDRGGTNNKDIMVSRFLEQATFGPTRDEINSWDETSSLESTFPRWIDQQIAAEATLHREYFRLRANTRVLQTVDIGQPLHPCDKNSRWSMFALNMKDTDQDLKITRNNGRYLFSINDVPRTEVDNIATDHKTISVPGTYKICWVNERVGGIVRIKIGGQCVKLIMGNPTISFSSNITPPNIFTFTSWTGFNVLDSNKQDDEFIRPNAITNKDDQCNFLHTNDAWPAFAHFPTNNEWLLYDPRLILNDNTLTQPLPDGGGSISLNGATCANVPRTFLTATSSCRLSNELSTCGVYDFGDAIRTLNEETARMLYEKTGKYVYVVDGLRPDTSPCTPSYQSRWLRVSASECSGGGAASLPDGTLRTITRIFEASGDTNPIMRDIQMYGNPNCDVGSTAPVEGKGIKIIIGSDCWENIHPHHHNVYDMTYWTKATTHPGNEMAANNGRPNPIKAFAKQGEAVLVYPSWHPIERWGIHEPSFTRLGRLQDNIHFQDLPDYLRLESVATEFGAIGTSPSGEGTIVCGSPGEISNDLTLGDRFAMPLDNANDVSNDLMAYQKGHVWTNAVLSASDQLRQRMAWALSQILTMSPGAIRASSGTEIFLNYYDIFVRNAFGNYRDVLKEVSYSPMMAEMLSYWLSKSTSYNYERSANVILFPDENYAREIMQLFTIGTVMLNIDGTPIYENGTPVSTYDNDDIMTYARAWTGFARQNQRGNIEDINNANRIDPMRIVAEWRDMFPKMDLFDGYVGDGYPLCEDLPTRSYLKKGATYRLLGSNPYPELQIDNFSSNDTTLRLDLIPGESELYNALCRPSTPGGDDCDLSPQIILDQDLSCDSSANSAECVIDTPRVVRVNDHTYYEYIRLPCVELAFYNDGKKISGWRQNYAMCGNPQLAHASEACCSPGEDTAVRSCEFVGERMAYDTAVSRCEAIGKETCHFRKIIDKDTNVCNGLSRYHWNDASCDVSIKIDNEGAIAIVHEPEDVAAEDVVKRVSRHSPSYFGVYWEEGFPLSVTDCGGGDLLCEVIDNECFCKTIVTEDSIFKKFNEVPLDVKAFLSRVGIGSQPLDTFPAGTFKAPKNRKSVKVYYRVGEYMTPNTIFEVTIHGQKKYYRNIESTVSLKKKDGTPATSYTFRNPPHFMGIVDQEERDAQYETDAVLDNYFHHDNTAPFLSIRFIQRFGISNPSPHFVKRVATAFVSGQYNWNKGEFKFGTGEYGDLAATVAAILLDHESRSLILERDPSYGSLKEPLLKIMGLMRSMEFQPNPAMPEVRLKEIMTGIGQMAHEIPSVFSFFLPEYSPQGRVLSASLVSPESQLLLMPKVIGLLNGAFSMVKYGLSECYSGWGQSKEGRCIRTPEGNFATSWGELTFSPSSTDAATVVEELSMLLTAGRLGSTSRQIIENAYNGASDNAAGLRLAQQLILTSGEFHSTNLVEMSGDARGGGDSDEDSNNDNETADDTSYKAIVFLLLQGGCDSFNMLVPLSNCKDQKDMYQEYADVRGELALSKNPNMAIDTSGSSQVCDKFFVHPNLSYLKTLYDQKDAVFFANTGVMTEPVTKEDWKFKTKTQLFAHNYQQKATQQVDPLNEADGTGVLGRMTDVLTTKGYKTGSVSIADDSYALVGTNGVSPPINFLSSNGVTPFNENPSMDNMSSAIKNLNAATTSTSGIFADTWSDAIHSSIDQNKALSEALEDANVNTSFPGTKIGQQLEIVSRMIKAHGDRGTQRDVFYVTLGGFDTHSYMKENLVERFTEINDAIKSFHLEMDHQNEWDNIVMVETSDFGRTLTSNNNEGSDHGWGGNYFMMGGSVDGGRILGEYPEDITSAGPQSIKRERVIPTTSWDEIWNGIGQWFGVADEGDLDKVLPNRGEFNNLFEQGDLFVQSIAETQRRKNLRK